MKKLLNRGSFSFAFIAFFYVLCIRCTTKNKVEEHHSMENSGVETHMHDAKEKVYTCSMHPEIIRNAPGNCPICNMSLVQKGVNSSNEKLSLGTVLAPVNETVIANIKYAIPAEKILESEIPADGYITYNPKNTSAISSRIAGRIEKLYVKFNFQEVKKGQKLIEIYSPEMLAAQQNYIFLLKNKEEDAELIISAKQKMRVLGMSNGQMEKITKLKIADLSVAVFATTSGHVHQMVSPNELTMPVMPSLGVTGMNTQSTSFSLKEGDYISKGKELFNIISLSDMWAILQVNTGNANNLKIGMPVRLSSEIAPQKFIEAKIDYIEPLLEKDSKFISARIYLKKLDHHIFKVGSLIKGIIQASEHKGLWIPATAVLNLGNDNNIVFKKHGSYYKTLRIKIGYRSGNEVSIISGLSKNDSIASSAWYLIDSESFVTVK